MVQAHIAGPEDPENWIRQSGKSTHYLLPGPSALIDLRLLNRVNGGLTASPRPWDKAMAGWPHVEMAFWYGAHGGSTNGGAAEAAVRIDEHLKAAERRFSVYGPQTVDQAKFPELPYRYELALAALPIYGQLARRQPISGEHIRGYSLAVANVAERVLKAWQKAPDGERGHFLGLTPELFAILAINHNMPLDAHGNARYVAVTSTARQDRAMFADAMELDDLGDESRPRENWDISVIGLHHEGGRNPAELGALAQFLLTSTVSLPSGLHHAQNNGWALRAKIQAENGLAVSFVRDREQRGRRFRGDLGNQVLRPRRGRAAPSDSVRPLGIRSSRTRANGYIPEITSWGMRECVGTTDRDTALRALRVLMFATRGEGGYTKASITELMKTFRRDMAERLAATSDRLAVSGNGHRP